jgi:hypothetical protein
MNTQARLSPDAAYRHYNRNLWVAMGLYTVLILVWGASHCILRSRYK